MGAWRCPSWCFISKTGHDSFLPRASRVAERDYLCEKATLVSLHGGIRLRNLAQSRNWASIYRSTFHAFLNVSTLLTIIAIHLVLAKRGIEPSMTQNDLVGWSRAAILCMLLSVASNRRIILHLVIGQAQRWGLLGAVVCSAFPRWRRLLHICGIGCLLIPLVPPRLLNVVDFLDLSDLCILLARILDLHWVEGHHEFILRVSSHPNWFSFVFD